MFHHQHNKHDTLEGTGRIEAFSDGVIAIVVTLLILEIRIPEIHQLTNAAALSALIPVIPKLISFAVSFITVAIFWVNHHHFFHPIEKSDGELLWFNNHLLFWLTVIPFVTAFIGDYPTIPLIVALYGFVLFMAALAFTLMSYHVFFRCELLPERISMATRKKQFKRSLFGVFLYGSSVIVAFIHPYLALAIFAIVPIYFFLPQSIA